MLLIFIYLCLSLSKQSQLEFVLWIAPVAWNTEWNPRNVTTELPMHYCNPRQILPLIWEYYRQKQTVAYVSLPPLFKNYALVSFLCMPSFYWRETLTAIIYFNKVQETLLIVLNERKWRKIFINKSVVFVSSSEYLTQTNNRSNKSYHTSIRVIR